MKIVKPVWWVYDLGWHKFVPNPACCEGCANRHWDMFLTLWLAIGEGYSGRYVAPRHNEPFVEI